MMKMHVAALTHITPNADEAIAQIARVSNPSNEDNRATYPKLIRYLIDHNHWSPFETVHATVEVWTTRDIGRQLLRHRSFSFQEFSGRYASYSELVTTRMCRFQDPKNRQSSIMVRDMATSIEGDSDNPLRVADANRIYEIEMWWRDAVKSVAGMTEAFYNEALKHGIAKEVARAILPEGLVPTRMYVCGSIRSFIHYCKERLAPGVQLEHQLLAGEICKAVFERMPMLWAAAQDYMEAPDFDQITGNTAHFE